MWKQSNFNASASSSSWSFMLPSSLPLPHIGNFLLPLPAPDRISCFQVRFRFKSLSSKCFRFHKNLTASTASASSFRIHIPVCNSCDWQSTRFHKLQVTLLGFGRLPQEPPRIGPPKINFLNDLTKGVRFFISVDI